MSKALIFGLVAGAGILAVKAASKNNGPAPGGEPNKPIDPLPSDPAPNKTPVNNYTPAANDAFPLKQGSKGPAVKNLQKLLIVFYTKKGNTIVKTDPMQLVAGEPDGSFGPQTMRYVQALFKTNSVTLEQYNWLYAGVLALQKTAAPAPTPNATGFAVGDLIYSKGDNTFQKYAIPKLGTGVAANTLTQVVSYINAGKASKAAGTVDFVSGKPIGRVIQIDGNKIRIIATFETKADNFWVTPIPFIEYVVATPNQIFK